MMLQAVDRQGPPVCAADDVGDLLRRPIRVDRGDHHLQELGHLDDLTVASSQEVRRLPDA